MNNNVATREKGLLYNYSKLTNSDGTEDISIDIFCESMTDYLQKLDAASAGYYELDDYDLQVINVAMDQFALALSGRMK